MYSIYHQRAGKTSLFHMRGVDFTHFNASCTSKLFMSGNVVCLHYYSLVEKEVEPQKAPDFTKLHSDSYFKFLLGGGGGGGGWRPGACIHSHAVNFICLQPCSVMLRIN